ncbi:MAG: phage holin family protein [Deltaproteobacteria bacterium]|nr:phage holin family protein [Deltaproteobacteria bacterium]
MSGGTAILIKLGVRLVVFGLVFFIATRKNPKVIVTKKRVLPLIALVFAVLNTALYWLLAPILNVATMGAAGFLMPFVVNMVLLVGTVKIFSKWKWFEIQGVMTTLWMAAFLTLAHGALWLGLDYLPARF